MLYQNQKQQVLEEILTDQVRYTIQKAVQEGQRTIREGYLYRISTSGPEFIVACEVADQSGLKVTV